MSDTKPSSTEKKEPSQDTGLQFERRDIIKGLAAIPAILLYLWNYLLYF